MEESVFEQINQGRQELENGFNDWVFEVALGLISLIHILTHQQLLLVEVSWNRRNLLKWL